MCRALSGYCPKVVLSLALGVPGAIVQAYTKRSPVEMKVPATEGVISGKFSGMVDKWIDFFPRLKLVLTSVERESERERKEDDSHYWYRESQSPLIPQWK